MGAILLDQIWGRGFVSRPRDVPVLLAWAMIEQFGHRQRTAAWRLRGLVAGVRGRRVAHTAASAWGEMHHRGARTIAGR
jgi:hypothetical protein